MNIKLIFASFLILTISVNSQFLLLNNRYDYRNTTTQDFNDLVEFVICGLDGEGLNDLAALLQQTYLNLKQPNWQLNVKMLFGRYWQNGSNYYIGCQNQQQTLSRFAVRAPYVSRVRSYFASFGFKQQISCIDEIMMRQFLSDGFGTANNSRRIDIGPKLVRMVFHDSIDYNNLVDSQNNTALVQSGVDYCLYSGIAQQNASNVSDVNADPDHNRGLGPSQWFVSTNQRQLAPWVEVTDVEVLGALVALEDWFKGPKVNFKFGRRQGTCKQVLCIQDKCVNQTLFLKSSPAPHHWSNARNMDVFKQLGFNVQESVALIGAHTIGGVNVCTGFGNLNAGVYCQKNYPSSGFLDTGSFFDDTPAAFDNNYFKALTGVQLGSNNATQFPECNFLNSMTRNNYDFLQQQVCEKITHCNYTSGRASHMKNLRNVSYIDGRFRRIVNLPSDWNNLFDQATLIHMQLFALNQTEFFKTFASAYEKVTNLGYANNELQQCQPLGCSLSADRSGFVCQNQYDDSLTFDVNTSTDCSVQSQPQSCQLVGGYGVRGQIQCNGALYTCPIRNSSQNLEAIQKFLTQRV